MIDHCEDLNLSAGGDMHEGSRRVRWGLRGIPAAVRRRDGGARHAAGRTHRRALPRGAHFHPQRRRHGGVRQAARPRRHLRGHAAPFRAGRRRDAALRQQLQDEAAAARPAATWTRWWKASLAAPSTPSPPITRRTPAARRCRNSRRCPFGIIGLETAHRPGAGRTGATGQDHAEPHGGAVHHRSRIACCAWTAARWRPARPAT